MFLFYRTISAAILGQVRYPKIMGQMFHSQDAFLLHNTQCQTHWRENELRTLHWFNGEFPGQPR